MKDLSNIYNPLCEDYIKTYFKNSYLTNNNWPPENLARPCTPDVQRELNEAYRSGLYEGLNNGFIEGFCKCKEIYDNIDICKKVGFVQDVEK